MINYNNDHKDKWQSHTIYYKYSHEDGNSIGTCFYNSFPNTNAAIFGYGLEDVVGCGATKEEAIDNFKIALSYLMDQLKEFEKMVMTPGFIENNLVEVDCLGKPLDEINKMGMKKVTENYKYELTNVDNGSTLIISKRSKTVFEYDKIERVISGSMAEEIFSWIDDKYIVKGEG